MKKLLPLFLIALCQYPVLAQWLPAPAPAGGNLDHVFFTDNLNGYTTSATGYIYKTTDGGNTWVQKYQPGQLTGFEQYVFNAIFFRTPQQGMVVGYDFWNADYLILSTSNGGDTWSPYVYEFGFNIGENNAADFPTANTAFAAGDYGRVFKTTNGGQAWQISATPGGTNDRILDLDFIDGQTGFLLDHNAKLYKTTNGGTSYQTIVLPQYMQSVQFLNAQTGFVCGYSGAYKTTDGGNSWTLLGAIPSQSMSNLIMIDENTGFAFIDGRLCKTTNGCVQWYQQEINLNLPINTNAAINEMFCTDAQTGWLCGFRELNGNNVSLLAKTSNGGGIGVDMVLSEYFFECPGDVVVATPLLTGAPTTINWYFDQALVASGLGPQTFSNLTSGLHEIRMEAIKGANKVVTSKSIVVAEIPDFTSSFNIGQQPCAGESALVSTNYSDGNYKMLVFQNNVLIDTASFNYNPFGGGTFLLPPVTTSTTFVFKSAYTCGDLLLGSVTVDPRPLPKVDYTLTAPETVFCEVQSGVTFTQSGSEPGTLYRLFRNNSDIGFFWGTGDPITYYTYAFQETTNFTILANNSCLLPLEDSLTLFVEHNDARFGVNGVNLPTGTPVTPVFQGIPAVSYQWSFGQNATPAFSTDAQPGTIQYNGDVSTQMQLITEGPLGCRDTFTRNIALYTPQNIGEYWAQEMDASNQYAYAGNSVAVDNSGNIVVTGIVNNPSELPSRAGTGLQVDKGSSIFKYDKFGVLQWKLQNEDKSLRTPAVAIDQEGNSIAVYTPDVLQSNEFMYFGSADETRRKVIRHWSSIVCKYNPDGNLMWLAEAKICNESGLTVLGVEVDTDNNIYVLSEPFNPQSCNYQGMFLNADSSSFTQEIKNPFVAKLSPEGTFEAVWPLANAGGQTAIFAKSFAVDAQKNILVGGEVGVLLAKYDPAGNQLWALSPEPQSPAPYFTLWQLAVDSDGNAYINGQFRGVLKFGNITLSVPFSGSDWDHFIMKVSPDGQVLWAVTGQTTGLFNANDIVVHGDDVYAGVVFTNDYTSGSLSIQTPAPNVFAGLWLQLSASTGGLKKYAVQMTPNPSTEWAEYRNYGNSIAFDSTGNIHLLGSNGYQTVWGNDTLHTPRYLFLAKIQGFDGVVATNDLADQQSLKAHIVPNPASGTASLWIVTENAQQVSCRISNLQGGSRPVFEKRDVPAGRTGIPISVTTPGVYFVELFGDKGGHWQVKWVVLE